MAEDGEWNIKPGDIVSLYPTMLSLTRHTPYDTVRLDIGLPKGFYGVLESLMRGVAQGEGDMVYVVPEYKERVG